MVIKNLKSGKFVPDSDFDSIYPPKIQSLSERHWTPVAVAKEATTFLCHKQGLKILDAGSGVGKFCIVGAVLYPDCTFYGVDFRDNLIGISNDLKSKYKFKNVEFIHNNLLDVSFNEYDGVYFFNSFHERIDNSSAIDNRSKVSYELYEKYALHIRDQFDKMSLGTRIATYYTSDYFIPDSYERVGTCLMDRVKYYVKVKTGDSSNNLPPLPLVYD